jgi:heme-degrading monooxygenase HmoA
MAEPNAYHLAQVNVARWRVPSSDPTHAASVADFMALLDPINALADRSPGFVWRLQTEDGNATSIRPFDDPDTLVNLSVWESLEALRDYVYASRHLDVMRRRREWFERVGETYIALWWIPAGTIPTVDDAKRQLDLLRRIGPSPAAFTFREPFPSPDADILVGDDTLS